MCLPSIFKPITEMFTIYSCKCVNEMTDFKSQKKEQIVLLAV